MILKKGGKVKKYSILLFIIALILCSCSTVKYVPVEKVKTEYINKIEKDTLVVRDSIFQREKGDTVFLEKYKVIYKTKYLCDTAFIHDSIPVVKEIIVTETTNILKKWQIVLMCLGIIFILFSLYKVYKVFKL
jgi:TM2 domain-containing membrane protein YozV